MSKLLLRETHG